MKSQLPYLIRWKRSASGMLPGSGGSDGPAMGVLLAVARERFSPPPQRADHAHDLRVVAERRLRHALDARIGARPGEHPLQMLALRALAEGHGTNAELEHPGFLVGTEKPEELVGAVEALGEERRVAEAGMEREPDAVDR